MKDDPYSGGWWWQSGFTSDEIGAQAKSNHAYLTDLETYDENGRRLFSAISLSNRGRAWWWYHSSTPDELGTKLAEHQAIPTRLATHGDGSSRRFAAIMQQSPGYGYWWYFNLTADQLGQKLVEHDAYPNDIVAYLEGGVLLFAAILYPNDGAGYWWYFGLLPADIADRLRENNAEPYRIHAYGTSDGVRYVAIMAPATKPSWWFFGQDMENVFTETRKNCAYLTDMTTYLEDGRRLFTCIMKERPQPAINPDHHTKIRSLMDTTHRGGWHGFYLKRLNQEILYGFNESVVFDPASTIKLLIYIHAIRAVQDGVTIGKQQIGFNTIIPIPLGFTSLPQSTCPFDEINTTAADMLPLRLDDALRSMMMRSRNAPTEALRLFFGESNVAATAQRLGLINTRHFGPTGCVRNAATLEDFGFLFEQAQSSYLNAANWTQFVDLAQHIPIFEINGIIDSVVASLPLLAGDFRDRFRNRMTCVFKEGNGADTVMKKSVAGYITLPFHDGLRVIDRQYVYGVFVDGASAINPDPMNPSNPFNLHWVVAEMLRFELENCVRSFSVPGRSI
jgi:hypothetical protein